MPLCSACGQDNPEQARFCLACGSPLAPPAPPAEERKPITAVFCDLVGSTARAEQLDPEDVRALLVPYHTRAKAELERFGGTVEKFIGDAVVGVFGAPLSHEDDPERAVRGALAIKEAMAELNTEDEWLDLHIRIGVNTGEALVIVGARPSEGEGMAAGDVMNTAARLQSSAPVDGIAVGAATFRATARLFEYRELEPIQAKGKTEPVPVWELVGERVEAERSTPRTPLVGRAAELEELSSHWDVVLSGGRPALATVLGAPGIGKSRLLRAFCERVGAAAEVHAGRCLPYGEGITYWPVIEILKSVAGILQSDRPAVVSEKLDALLDSLPTSDSDELRTTATALANLIGAPTTPLGTYSAEELPQAELHWGIRRAVQLLARVRPLVLVFEDLHWAEPTLLDLLQFIVEPQDEARILVLGSARPELAESRHAVATPGSATLVIQLDALTDAEGAKLVMELLGAASTAAGLPEKLLRKAGGNPLFLEEIVRMVADTGVGGDADLATLPVPDSLQALIGARLDGLAGEEKRVAQHAAVVGAVFWAGAVAHLNGTSDPIARLAELERRDFVQARPESSVADDREYAFKHILIRDVAYERLPRGRRAELHVRFSEWLERLTAADDEFAEILGYHLEQACQLARSVAQSPVAPPVLPAVDALTRSADKAERREGMREADRFYERALALVGDEHPESALELRLRHCGTLVALGELTRAHRDLLDVAEKARAFGRPDLRCGALLRLANVESKQGRASAVRERLEEAEILAAQTGDDRLRIRAQFELSNLRAWFDGDMKAAVDGLSRALELAERAGDRDLRIEGRMRLGTTLFNAGRLAEAEHQLERCLALSGESGSIRDDARASSMLGLYRYYRGDLDEAERLALQALEWLERTGDTYLQVQNLRELARYALVRGDPQLAEQRLRQAVPLALESGGWLVIEIYRYLTEALVGQGRLEEARELVAFAGRNLPEEDHYARAALRVAEALVATAAEEEVGALKSFTEALTLLEEQNLLTDLGDIRIAFGRSLRRFGNQVAARAELERARNVFAPMEAQGPLAEIERELAQLGVGAGASGPHASS